MTENQVPAWMTAGDLTAVPANDNQLRALGAAIGKVDCYTGLSDGRIYALANTAYDFPLPVINNLPPVVAFTGIAGSGKSTATRYLVERHGYTLVKFAGPLKDMMRAIGLAESQIEGDAKETPTWLLCGKSPRHAMQTLGTQWGRDCIGEEFWVQLWRHRADNVISDGGRVVTDDCRFPNESTAIRRLGGDIYKIDGRGGIAGEHISERGCGDQDLVLVNDGEVALLHKRVEEALKRYG